MRQTMAGKKNIVVREYPQQHYKTVFNQKTGFFVRMENRGYEEPFWCETGPELLDVSITNYCERRCEFCYRDSSHMGQHMRMNDMEKVVKEAAQLGVLQIALGGGNPNQHPHFTSILKLIRGYNIIPSFTTNGDYLTDDILDATRCYCGAIAISAYPPFDDSFAAKIKTVARYIKTNLHFILKSDTIDIANQWLTNPPDFLEHINAIIFLNYKPIKPITDLRIKDKNKIVAFFQNVQNCKSLKIGFDSCSVASIVHNMKVDKVFIESCEAARFSAFISENMKMYPCSFMTNTVYYGDLRTESIGSIWKNNQYFIRHRSQIKNHNCHSCKYATFCNGGCVYMPEINFCI